MAIIDDFKSIRTRLDRNVQKEELAASPTEPKPMPLYVPPCSACNNTGVVTRGGNSWACPSCQNRNQSVTSN